MDEPTLSPWWYRQRALLIGLAYAAGFFFGYLSLAGPPRQPAFVTWGYAIAGGAGIEAMAWLAVALALSGWAIRFAGTSYLRREVVFAANVQEDRLVVAGPFRHVRNPLYLGNIILSAGVGLLAPPLGFVLVVAGNVAIVFALAAEEVNRLSERYGAAFAAYRAAVPAFLPRVTPASVPGSVATVPSFRSGFVGEIGILAMAAALVPIAVAGRAGLPAFYVIWAAGIVATLIVNRRRNSPGSVPRT